MTPGVFRLLPDLVNQKYCYQRYLPWYYLTSSSNQNLQYCPSVISISLSSLYNGKYLHCLLWELPSLIAVQLQLTLENKLLWQCARVSYHVTTLSCGKTAHLTKLLICWFQCLLLFISSILICLKTTYLYVVHLYVVNVAFFKKIRLPYCTIKKSK